MFKRARYIHAQVPWGTKYKGWSVLLEPAESPDSVKLRVTFCSMHDQFCKKTAREALETKGNVWHMPVRSLPSKLEEFDSMCEGIKAKRSIMAGNLWAWVWKYFL